MRHVQRTTRHAPRAPCTSRSMHHVPPAPNSIRRAHPQALLISWSDGATFPGSPALALPFQLLLWLLAPVSSRHASPPLVLAVIGAISRLRTPANAMPLLLQLLHTPGPSGDPSHVWHKLLPEVRDASFAATHLEHSSLTSTARGHAANSWLLLWWYHPDHVSSKYPRPPLSMPSSAHAVLCPHVTTHTTHTAHAHTYTQHTMAAVSGCGRARPVRHGAA